MKKTLNVNIGSMPFVIDEDAYRALSQYLDDVASRITEEHPEEVMDDLERRIADLFNEDLGSRNQVVSIAMVRRVIAIIGEPGVFGNRRGYSADERYKVKEPRRFYRSRDQNVIAGICGGIAEYFNLDVSLVRVITFLLIFLGGVSLWAYIVLWIAIPLGSYKLSR